MAKHIWLLPKEVAEMSGVGLATLSRRRYLAMKPPFHRSAFGIRYKLEDIVAWIKDTEVKCTSSSIKVWRKEVKKKTWKS